MIEGIDEQLKVPSKLVIAGVVKAFDRGIFDCPVHGLDLTIGPRTVRLGQLMFDPMHCTNAIEQMACKSCCWPVPIA